MYMGISFFIAAHSGPEDMSEVLYCLEHKFSGPLTTALLELRDSECDEDLDDAYFHWRGWVYTLPGMGFGVPTFVEAVHAITGDNCRNCSDCGHLKWVDNMTKVQGGDYACDYSCIDNYVRCRECNEYVSEADSHYYAGNWCQECFDEEFTHCDHCEQYYRNNEGHDFEHDDSCSCEAPHPQFSFPANGDGVVRQNERLRVELPRGTIDAVGLQRIRYLLTSELCYGPEVLGTLLHREDKIDALLADVGAVWQTKRGNFTRRVSTALYKKYKVKLASHSISEIGNLARAHSSDEREWYIEFTRDLNAPPDEFANSDSCWWGGYEKSRCCLKSWGGMGLRSYAHESWSQEVPAGRAWVQPLNGDLKPTHDALNAQAYVVFNGYGALEDGYTPARIIGHLTGKTYRRIELTAANQYINSSTGYLVADEATCAKTQYLRFPYAEHNQQDADEIQDTKVAA